MPGVPVSDEDFTTIPAGLASEIEDAIMFGKAHDLEMLLENTHEAALPADLRQGLESLHYFRAHYGDMPMGEVDKKKTVLMDSAWAMELLNKIRARIEAAIKSA